MPVHTSPIKVSPLPPSNIFDDKDEGEFDSDDDGQFGSVHTPSELNIKYLQDNEDDYTEH